MGLDGINSNNFNNEIKPADDNQQIKPKKIASLFDSFFDGKEKDIADCNKDGSISFDEASNYIKNFSLQNYDSRQVLLKIAAFLGVEMKSNIHYEEDSSFFNEILNNIENLKKADKDGDQNVTFQEAKSLEGLDKNNRLKLNRIFGIVDNEINNKQGGYGTCHLLTAGTGIAKQAPKVFENIIKQDEEGNVTVTLYGADSEPFSIKIPNRILRLQQERRARVKNNAMIHGEKATGYGSSDPEAIALEMAYANYGRKIEKDNKLYLEKLQNYIDNSEFKMVEKPSIEGVTFENITQEKLDELYNYYYNSANNEGVRGNSMFVFIRRKEYLTEEQFNTFINEYYPNSQPIVLEKPKRLTAITEVENWLKNSSSESVEKPEMQQLKSSGSLNSGGFTERSIQLLAGGTFRRYASENTKPEIIETELANITSSYAESDDNVNIYSADFKAADLDGKIKAGHAYLVDGYFGEEVILVDPHDSSKKIYYPKKRFLENYKNFGINTIENKI